jgi:flagellin
MGLSIQTNVTSLVAQENLRVNNDFQSRTIQRLTSGYRINSSGDDAAGLAIANGFRSDVAELSQGVRNANDGLSTLQIIDGGLNNISKTLDRLKTLATQSASTTFTGNRSTLNSEYQSLMKEINRQANNIGLNSGGRFNSQLGVYIGGANNLQDAQVSVDLSGTQNAVDSNSLGLSTSNILAGGVGLSGNTQRLDAPGALFLTGGGDTQALSFNTVANGSSTTRVVTVSGGASGISSDEVLSQLNSQLNDVGITASLAQNGTLQFSGATAFTVGAATATGTNGIITTSTASTNTSNFTATGGAFTAGAATLTFQTSSANRAVSLLATDSLDAAIGKINAALAQDGINAVRNGAGTGISIQGSNSFSLVSSAASTGFATSLTAATAPTAGSGSNAVAAISQIETAIGRLGNIQGRVGTGQNRLAYSIQLAQSQISSFSAAESRIRDADVAQEAANLTKAQVLQQASLAALAQANSAPQSVLSLLRG